MQTTPSQPIKENKILLNLKKIGQFLSIVATTSYKLAQDVQIFVSHVMKQSKTIEILQNQNQEIESLKEKILYVETETAKVEALETQLLKFQGKIALLEKGRKYISLQP